MSIKYKILSGFSILALLLIIAAIISIYEFRQVSHSVDAILEDNFKSMNASKTMIEALEAEERGLLLLMLGSYEMGIATLERADSLFYAGFVIAKNNISLPNEQLYINEIESYYAEYKRIWVRPMLNDNQTKVDVEWYKANAIPLYTKVKSSVTELLNINNRNIYLISSELKNRARRAIMPGIVAIISALLFTLIFNYFINYYIVRPILNIIHAIQLHSKNKVSYNVKIETRDEIHELNNSIQNLL
jgi:methyl-accepting chemotaxis protein